MKNTSYKTMNRRLERVLVDVMTDKNQTPTGEEKMALFDVVGVVNPTPQQVLEGVPPRVVVPLTQVVAPTVNAAILMAGQKVKLSESEANMLQVFIRQWTA